MTHAQKSRTVPVSHTGRLNLPADMRRALGLVGAGRVIVTEEENGLRITTMEQSLKHIRELARPYRPRQGYASDDLIADRRAEAQRESETAQDRSND
ncbi:AbrB/MazE/SpoVT family DNA-binding domain-containing protein (plasmid) [Ensifer sp. D2-11]